jgi:hypothetical protein
MADFSFVKQDTDDFHVKTRKTSNRKLTLQLSSSSQCTHTTSHSYSCAESRISVASVAVFKMFPVVHYCHPQIEILQGCRHAGQLRLVIARRDGNFWEILPRGFFTVLGGCLKYGAPHIIRT